MRNLSRWMLALAFTSLGISSVQAANQVDPTVFSLKIYEARVSPRADCGGGFIRVFQSASPSYQDMLSGPTLGSGPVPFGTYRCVAIRMSDVIQYTPAVTTTGGNCVAGTPYSKNILRGEVTTSPEGESITTVDGPDLIWIYLSTSGTESNGATIPTEPGPLGAPLVVNAQGSGSFVTDARGGVEDLGPGNCSLETVHFSFR